MDGGWIWLLMVASLPIFQGVVDIYEGVIVFELALHISNPLGQTLLCWCCQQEQRKCTLRNRLLLVLAIKCKFDDDGRRNR